MLAYELGAQFYSLLLKLVLKVVAKFRKHVSILKDLFPLNVMW